MPTTYSQKLKHPFWQKKRLEILERDDFTCQLCYDQHSTLHVHHKIYKDDSEPWEYENEELITYCNHCHRIVESLKMNKNLIFIRIYKEYPMAFCVTNRRILLIHWVKSIPEVKIQLGIENIISDMENFTINNQNG